MTHQHYTLRDMVMVKFLLEDIRMKVCMTSKIFIAIIAESIDTDWWWHKMQ